MWQLYKYGSFSFKTMEVFMISYLLFGTINNLFYHFFIIKILISAL